MGEGVISLSNCFLSEILIWDSNKNYSEKLPKDIKTYEAVSTHLLVIVFLSAEIKTIKAT